MILMKEQIYMYHKLKRMRGVVKKIKLQKEQLHNILEGDMSLATFPTIPTIPSLMTQADITA